MESFLINLGPILGSLIVFSIIFAESGLLIGFFLPGDTLLLSAGVLSALGIFNLPVIIILCFIAAVLGDSVGYFIGKKYGIKLFSKEDSVFFHRKHLATAEHFYEKHGKKTIVLARFVPIIRTFAPTVAGIGNMNYRTFLTYNILGGGLWAIGLPVLGYGITKLFPDIHLEKYVEPILIVMVVASVAPALYHLWKANQKSKTEQILGE
jgi:membrane-associated protein